VHYTHARLDGLKTLNHIVGARGKTFTFDAALLCALRRHNILFKSIFIFGPSGSASRRITQTRNAGHKSIRAELVAYRASSAATIIPYYNDIIIIIIITHRTAVMRCKTRAPIVYGRHSPPENHETSRTIPSLARVKSHDYPPS